MMHGIPVGDKQHAGGRFEWLAPLPVATGNGLVLGYALLGAGWLIMKSEGALREWAWPRCASFGRGRAGGVGAGLFNRRSGPPLSLMRLSSLMEPKINPDARERDVLARQEALGSRYPLDKSAAWILQRECVCESPNERRINLRRANQGTRRAVWTVAGENDYAALSNERYFGSHG
jgi:hypothetical protein